MPKRHVTLIVRTAIALGIIWVVIVVATTWFFGDYDGPDADARGAAMGTVMVELLVVMIGIVAILATILHADRFLGSLMAPPRCTCPRCGKDLADGPCPTCGT
jgi:hypothetical protein